MTKPRLTFLQIWNMCFGFLGVQIGFGLQNANASRIFQTLGANVDRLPILWIAAPITGLLVQPIVGHWSDRTWGRLGRRRPYFFWGAILTAAAMLLMPNAPALWVAAGGLWLMDGSINVTMEPFRAFVGDLLGEDQRTAGFAMQSFFIGVGAVFASALPWLLSNVFGVSDAAAPGVTPASVRWAFYIGAACLLAAVMWTVFTTQESPPERVDETRPGAPAELTAGRAMPAARLLASGLAWTALGGAGFVLLTFLHLEKELYVLAGAVAIFGTVQLFAWTQRRGAPERRNGFLEVVDDIFAMPATMRALALVQFFSWFGLFAMWIYTTSAVTSFHYGVTDPASHLYNQGADWVGVLFAVYNGVAAVAALLLPALARRIGRRACHALSLCLGGAGLAAFSLIRDPAALWIPMIGVGFAWASILSMPYAMLAGALPAGKMGVYMGIFNFFIVIPQIVAATILGLLVRQLFGGQAISALVLGGASMGLAAVCVLLVREPGRASDRGDLAETALRTI